MSVPSAETIVSDIIDRLPGAFKNARGGEDGITTQLEDFLDHIIDELQTAWASWAGSVNFGGVSVSGAGLGTWTGTGSGGSFTTSPSCTLTPYYEAMSWEEDFVAAVQDSWEAEIQAWASAFTFSSVTYNGTSTATTEVPGVFNATNVDTLLTHYSYTTGDIAEDIRTELEGYSFNLTNGQAGDLADAIGDALKNQFDTWRGANYIKDNTVTGTAAAGTGAGNGTSANDGVIE